MSPASSGNLEVERYIGACLITQNRNKKLGNNNNSGRELFYPDQVYQGNNYLNLDNRYRLQRCNSNSIDGWAGGMPLISFTTGHHQRRNGVNNTQHVISEQFEHGGQQNNNNPLARLAVHTQGAPLILTKNYNHRKNNNNNKVSNYQRNNNNTTATKQQFENKINIKSKCSPDSISVSGVDTISVTSDESSGSTNSENYLPRIIKPRKRRKKDRKLPLLERQSSQDGFSTSDSASPDIIDTSSSYNNPGVNALLLQGYNTNNNIPFTFESSSSYNNVYNNNQSVPLDDENNYRLNDISEIPKLHHCFEDVEELLDDDSKDMNGNNQPAMLCQCRYCDPSGQIWDVDRSCYSPFLTAPNHRNNSTLVTQFEFPHQLNYNNTTISSSSETGPNYCRLIHSLSGLSLESSDSNSIKNNQILFPNTSSSQRDLEVSSEIVTSLHGHRDLEIKFFSSTNNNDNNCRKMQQQELDDDLKLLETISVSVVNNNECKTVADE